MTSELLQIFLDNWLLFVAFFFVAILYSSVGFGGGSSYSALLSLTGLSFVQFRGISLLCNIVVVSEGTYFFNKNNLYNWKKVLPLIFFSIPFAFLGGILKIEQQFFYILLAISLILAGVLMFLPLQNDSDLVKIKKFSFIHNAIIGGSIGFLSGIVGIGGGVFLAPLLYITKWDVPRRIAATSSFFILVNSISGFLGQIQNPNFSINWYLTILLLIAVFLGGQIGSKLSVKKLNSNTIKFITAILIVFIGFKLLHHNIL